MTTQPPIPRTAVSVRAPLAPRWEALAAKLAPFIRKRVRSEADVEDILQDVLLRMHRGLPLLEDQTKLMAWMYSIARFAIADFLRAKQRSEVPQPPEKLEEPVEAPELPEHDIAQTLASALALFVPMLPSPYREAITLTELEGRTQREAARMLGVSNSAMKSRVQRGRAKLRQMLEDCCEIALDARGHVIACEPRGTCRWEEGCDPPKGTSQP